MIVTMLGTAQDGGVPHVNCRCAACCEADRHPSKKRLAPSVGLYDRKSGDVYLIDASPHFDIQLRNLLKRVGDHRQPGRPLLDGIFLTHAHFGHYWGLGFLGKEAASPQKLPVYATEELGDFLAANRPFKDSIDRENLLIRTMEPGKAISLTKGTAITPFSVEHRKDVTDTVGFVIKGPQKTLLYVPDMDDLVPEVVNRMKQVEVAVIDGCFYSHDELPHRNIKEVPHPFIPDMMETLQEISKNTRIVFTHFNHSNYVLRPDSPEKKEVLSRGFHLAKDGDEFAL